MAECEDDFSTNLSLQKFCTLLDKLTPAQQEYVAEMGFGFLLDLCCNELPRALVDGLYNILFLLTERLNFPVGLVSC